MFDLRFGEKSPRITLLQILLKDEFGLRVDGIFGKNTLSVVKSFQRSRRQPETGVAAREAWTELLRGTDLVVVSSVDVGDPTLRFDVEKLKAVGDSPMSLVKCVTA